MQTKNILKKGLIICFLIIGSCAVNMAKAQTDSLKDSVMALPAKDDLYNNVDKKVEHPAEFVNGLEGWRKFLETHLNYPEKAQKKWTQGVVRIQLLVDKDGNVKEVKALNEPGDGLGKEAERVIKVCKYWIPARQDGYRVNYRFVQTITFQLQ